MVVWRVLHADGGGRGCARRGVAMGEGHVWVEPTVRVAVGVAGRRRSPWRSDALLSPGRVLGVADDGWIHHPRAVHR